MKRIIVYLLSFLIVEKNLPQNPPDSVTAAASNKYGDPSFFKKIFLGTNYRKEWTTPVKMPVFYVNKEKGGFTIIEMGGGQQTKSLQLKDKQGNEWALRTVDKEVEGALPKGLRNSFIKQIVQDLVSAAHPYAALTIPDLSKAVGVKTGSQQLFYVPDDPALGLYRPYFANKVCLLEQRSLPPYSDDLLDTDEMILDLVDENNRLVNQELLLRSRLLDMLVADWDRHSEQWKWAANPATDKKVYDPIPRDRDQAFFHSNGLVVFLSSITFMPHLEGFKRKSTDLEKLNYKAWHFDQDLLNQLDRKEWEKIVRAFQEKLTNAVIENAVKKLPPEIYAINGPMITARLKARRDGLLENVLEYYNLLASSVEVHGTDESEYFLVNADKDKLEVIVYSMEGENKNRILYKRIFDEDETNKIHLKGLGDNDHYKINGKVSGIRLIIDGGNGNDTINFDEKSKVTIALDDN